MRLCVKNLSRLWSLHFWTHPFDTLGHGALVINSARSTRLRLAYRQIKTCSSDIRNEKSDFYSWPAVGRDSRPTNSYTEWFGHHRGYIRDFGKMTLIQWHDLLVALAEPSHGQPRCLYLREKQPRLHANRQMYAVSLWLKLSRSTLSVLSQTLRTHSETVFAVTLR